MAPQVDKNPYLKVVEQTGCKALGSITGSGSYGQMAQQVWAAGGLWVDERYTQEQRIEGTATAALNIMQSLLTSSQASSKAEGEIKDGEQKVKNIDDLKNASADKYKKQINDIIAQIQANQAIVEQKLAEIEDSNKQKEEMQQQLADAQKTIEDNKEAAAKGDKGALAAITGAREIIDGLLVQVEMISSSISELNDEVSDIQQTNAELDLQSTAVNNEGQQEQEMYNQQIVQQQAVNAKVLAEAPKNIEKATELTAEAMALKTGGTAAGIFTFGLGTAAADVEAERLLAQAADNMEAAAIRTEGTGKIAASMSTVLLGINEYIGDYSSYFPTLIGDAISDSDSVSFDFFDLSNSLGSWLGEAEGLKTESEKLGESVDAAYAQLSESENNDDEPQKKDIDIYVPNLDEYIS